MEKAEISQEMVQMPYGNMDNWKAPGNDVQEYWLKNLAVQLNHILDGERLLWHGTPQLD